MGRDSGGCDEDDGDEDGVVYDMEWSDSDDEDDDNDKDDVVDDNDDDDGCYWWWLWWGWSDHIVVMRMMDMIMLDNFEEQSIPCAV